MKWVILRFGIICIADLCPHPLPQMVPSNVTVTPEKFLLLTYWKWHYYKLRTLTTSVGRLHFHAPIGALDDYIQCKLCISLKSDRLITNRACLACCAQQPTNIAAAAAGGWQMMLIMLAFASHMHCPIWCLCACVFLCMSFLLSYMWENLYPIYFFLSYVRPVTHRAWSTAQGLLRQVL